MRTRDRIALAALAAALTLAGALVGGSTRWSACAAAVAAIGAAAVHLTSRRTASHPGPLVVLVAIAAAATAVQLAPIPEVIAEIVAPTKLALVRDHAIALGDPAPRWVLVSYDPPATVLELAKLAGYLALAWAAARAAAQRRSRPYLAAAVVGSATVVAVIALGHRVVGASHLYGVFEMPEGALPSPLVNPNHLAGLTAMVVPLGLGLGLEWRGGRRVAAVGAALILAATALLTGSRGGAVGLVAGLTVAATILIAQRRAGIADDHRRAPLSITLPAVVVALCALTLFALVAARDVATELADTRLTELSQPHTKYQVWAAAAPLVPEHRWLGIGRGAFETTFPRLAPSGEFTFSHVENTYLQAVTDWGVPVALALGLALLAVARRAATRWRHGPLDAGALGALASIAIHDVADFSLEMPAVAMTAIVTAALVVPSRLSTDEKRGPVPRGVLARRAALLAVAALCVVVAATPLSRGARPERAALPPPTSPGAVAAARRVFLRHPADALAAGHLANALRAAGDPRALAVIQRALYQRPLHAGLHLEAARMLAPRQASHEYARALAYSRDPQPIVDEVLARLPAAADAARALPTEARHVTRVCRAVFARNRNDVVMAYTERLIALGLASGVAHTNRAWAALALGLPAEALPAADVALRRVPDVMVSILRARALDGLGRTPEAITQLRTGPLPTLPEHRVELAVLLADLQARAGDPTGARDTLAEAAAQLADSPRLEAAIRRALATAEDRLGHGNAAAWERRRAMELDGLSDSDNIR